jgi:hypothetical protein
MIRMFLQYHMQCIVHYDIDINIIIRKYLLWMLYIHIHFYKFRKVKLGHGANRAEHSYFHGCDVACVMCGAVDTIRKSSTSMIYT